MRVKPIRIERHMITAPIVRRTLNFLLLGLPLIASRHLLVQPRINFSNHKAVELKDVAVCPGDIKERLVVGQLYLYFITADQVFIAVR